MLTWKSGDISGPTISVRFDRFDGERCQYEWTVRLGDATDPSFSACDLRLGSGQEPNDVEALRALSSFLGAWVESQEYESRTGTRGENVDLFPSAMWTPFEAYWSEIADSLEGDVRERESA